MSTDQRAAGTGDVQQPGDQLQLEQDTRVEEDAGSAPFIVISAVLPLLFIGMIIAASALIFKPSDKASTAYTFSRSSSSSLQSSSSLTPSLTTTKAQTHPLPHAAERLFVCVLKNYGVVVPDGLCDVLLLTYRHRFPHGTLTRLLIVENFTNTNPGGSCIITKCGINMILLQTTDNQALDKLASADGTKDLQWFEGLNFRHYGMLNLRIGLHTEAAITRVINYFKALREKQNQMNTRGLHIIGVTPYFYTNTPTIGDDIKEDLRRIVTEVDLDALLIRTTQTESALFEPECRLTGPSLWTHLDNLEKQVTFVQSLEFARTVQLPSDLRILLSFSCTGFRTFYKSLSAHLSHQDIDIIRHEKCRVSQLANYGEENKCHQSKLMGMESSSMTNYVVHVTLSSRREDTVDMFDTNVTYKMKMCNAQKLYGFQGGYVLFDFEQIDTGNKCGDTNFTHGYADAHYIKTYMKTSLTGC